MANDQASASQSPPDIPGEYNGNAPFAVSIVFIILEVVCVALRFLARRVGKVPWGADDSLIIAGAIFCLAVAGAGLSDLQYGGVGYHEAAVAAASPSTLKIWPKYVLVFPVAYLPAVVLPKLAILVLYLRIFTKRRDRIACWVIGALMIANFVGTTAVVFCICTPLKFLWDPTIPGGHCINITAWYRWSSLMNIVSDVAMLILPLPIIWKIQTSKRIKVGLTITFATGSIGLITSIVRFSGFFAQNALADRTWTASKLISLSVVESGVYLIAACLPTYRSLAVFLWQKMPLPSPQPGAKTFKSGFSEGRHVTHDISLEQRPNDGFIRLDKSNESMMFLYKNQDIEHNV